MTGESTCDLLQQELPKMQFQKMPCIAGEPNTPNPLVGDSWCSHLFLLESTEFFLGVTWQEQGVGYLQEPLGSGFQPPRSSGEGRVSTGHAEACELGRGHTERFDPAAGGPKMEDPTSELPPSSQLSQAAVQPLMAMGQKRIPKNPIG